MESGRNQHEMLADIAEVRNTLFEDIRGALEFKPNRGRDIYNFMDAYLHEARYDNREEVKEEILGHLVDCAEGRSYPDPRAGTEPYTLADVDQLEAVVDGYISAVATGDSDAVTQATLALEEVVREFHEDPCSGMLDTWRRDQLHLLREACHDYLALSPALEEPELVEQEAGPFRDWGC